MDKAHLSKLRDQPCTIEANTRFRYTSLCNVTHSQDTLNDIPDTEWTYSQVLIQFHRSHPSFPSHLSKNFRYEPIFNTLPVGMYRGSGQQVWGGCSMSHYLSSVCTIECRQPRLRGGLLSGEDGRAAMMSRYRMNPCHRSRVIAG